jgi:hypothetical protein
MSATSPSSGELRFASDAEDMAVLNGHAPARKERVRFVHGQDRYSWSAYRCQEIAWLRS